MHHEWILVGSAFVVCKEYNIIPFGCCTIKSWLVWLWYTYLNFIFQSHCLPIRIYLRQFFVKNTLFFPTTLSLTCFRLIFSSINLCSQTALKHVEWTLLAELCTNLANSFVLYWFEGSNITKFCLTQRVVNCHQVVVRPLRPPLEWPLESV